METPKPVDKEWLDSMRKILESLLFQVRARDRCRDLGLPCDDINKTIETLLGELSSTADDQFNQWMPMRILIPQESRIHARNLAAHLLEGPPSPTSRDDWNEKLDDLFETFKNKVDPMYDGPKDLPFRPGSALGMYYLCRNL